MEIGPLSNEPSQQRRETQSGTGLGAVRPPQVSPGTIVDRAEISGEARARLAELADTELAREKLEPQAVDSDGQPDKERLDLVRERIASGYYDDPEVRSKIVDRLIDDLDG